MKKILSFLAICMMAVTSAWAADPDYVEIGGLRWAKMNLGATTVADSPETSFGDYYAWGATETWYSNISWSGSTPTITWKSGYTDGYTSSHVPTVAGSTLSATVDIATITYPGWRMPSASDYTALLNACYTSGITNVKSTDAIPTAKGIYFIEQRDATYKVAGVLFIDSNGASVFFPAAGYFNGTLLAAAGNRGDCWSSSMNTTGWPDELYFAYGPSFLLGSAEPRYSGVTVRAVQDGTSAINDVNASTSSAQAQRVIKTADYIIKNGKKYNYAGQRVK